MKRWDHTREKRGSGKRGLTLLAVTVLLLSLLTTGVLAFFSGRSNGLTNRFSKKPDTQYTVTLDANGGTNGSVTKLTQSSTASSYEFTLPSQDGQVPTRSEYWLLGWSTDKGAASATYQPGSKITLEANDPDVTLYAVWKAPVLKEGYTFNGLLTDDYNVILGSYEDYADAVRGLSYTAADEDDTGAYRVYVDDSAKINYVLNMVGSTFHANVNCRYMLQDMGTDADTGYIQGLELLDMSQVNLVMYMFARCHLKSLEIPAWDLSQLPSLTNLFGGSNANNRAEYGSISGLENLKGPKLTGVDRMFAYCTVRESVDLADLDMTNITDIAGMFQGFEIRNNEAQVTEVLRTWNTSKMMNMSYVFQDSSFTTYDMVEGWDVSKVISLCNMFLNVKTAGDLDLSGWNPSSVFDFTGMFQDCALTVDITGWQIRRDTQVTMPQMFAAYSGGEVLDLSSWSTSMVTDMEGLFLNSSLKTIYVGDGWSLSSIGNGGFIKPGSTERMFEGCFNLVGGNGTTWNASNPTDGTYAHVDGGPSNPGYFTNKGAVTYTVTLNANGGTAGTVTQLTYSSGEDSHTFTLPSAAGEAPSIDYGTLAGWSTDPYTASHHTDEVLNTITLTKDSPSITLYAVWDATVTLKIGYMFNWLLTDNYNVIFGSYAAYADEVNGLDWQAADQDDAGIYRVYRDDLNKINYVLSMVGSTFHPTNGNLGSLLSDMGTADGNGFVRGLEYLNVSEALYLSSFFASSNFVSLDLSCWDTSNVTGMSWMFRECDFLTELNLSGWDTSNCRAMVGLFNSCSSLTELDLSSWDTQAADDMTQMFEYCGGLRTIYVGDNWNTNNLDPDTGRFSLFDGCYNLVGGAGTTYDGSDYYTDYLYAHVDGGPSNPGYFTYKAHTP